MFVILYLNKYYKWQGVKGSNVVCYLVFSAIFII